MTELGAVDMWDDENKRRQMEKRLALFDLKKELIKDLLPCPFCEAKLEDSLGYMYLEKWHLQADHYRIICPSVRQLARVRIPSSGPWQTGTIAEGRNQDE